MKFKLPILNIFCLMLMTAQSARAGLYMPKIIDVAIGVEYLCVLDTETVRCYSLEEASGYSMLELIPNKATLVNPKKIAINSYEIVVLDDQGVKTWALYPGKKEFSFIPGLRNVIDLFGDTFNACALSENKKINCWGTTNGNSINHPPFLSNVKEVSIGSSFACAIANDKVRCWGAANYDRDLITPPSFVNPTKIRSGWEHSCALDSKGWQCWGNNEYLDNHVPEELRFAKDMAAGFYTLCALHNNEIKCWGGDEYGYNPTSRIPKDLKNPTALYSNISYYCVQDDEGLKCWTAEKLSPKPFHLISSPFALIGGPNYFHPSFHLDQYSAYLYLLANTSTKVRAHIYSSLNQMVRNSLFSTTPSQDLSVSRYLAFSLLSPMIKSSDSEYYTKTLIPQYTKDMQSIERELGMNSLQQIPDSPLRRQMALKVIQAAVEASTEFLTVADKELVIDFTRLIGAAMADPSSNSKIQSVINKWNQLSSVQTIYQQTSKLSFIVPLVQGAIGWLDQVAY